MNYFIERIERIFLICALVFVGILVEIGNGRCAESLTAVKSNALFTVDGMEKENIWSKAKPVVVHDNIANIDITVKALYNEQDIFILVKFPDPDESRTHKSWVWNKPQKLYEMGHDREDIFVLKWYMEFDPQGLSLFAGKPHKADVWYWKANRTDPSGYADDKIQFLRTEREKRATKITSPDGTVLYLTRKGDQGDAAYASILAVDYKSDREPRFENLTPTGSRADIQAKGVWRDGEWTIEFKRALNTGHEDDLVLEVNNTYTLGLSRFEVAGYPVDLKSDQPLYGTGDIHQAIILSFQH